MNIDHIHRNDELRDKLAGEYVRGTLRSAAHRRFEGWLQEDAALRHAVAEWQDRRHPMAEFAPAAQPPARVWRNIEKRLALRETSSRRAFWTGLREDLGFWRGLGMSSTALATILVTVLLTRQPEPVTSSVATLADEKS
jgi:anti-sigma-K factor RskA